MVTGGMLLLHSLMLLQDCQSNDFTYSMIEDTLPKAMAYEEPMEVQMQIDRHKYGAIEQAIITAGNILLMIPEIALDGIAEVIDSINGNGTTVDSSVTSKILDIQAKPTRQTLFESYLHIWHERELRYFNRLYESELLTSEVLEGDEVVDIEKFKDDQRDILIDALKDMYFAKYKLKGDERTKDVYSVYEWHGVDFVTMPILAGALLYYRGIDRRFTIANFKIAISLEPIGSIVRQGTLPFLLSFELGYKRIPIKIIGSLGARDDEIDASFIGLGTSVGAAKIAFSLKSAEDETDADR